MQAATEARFAGERINSTEDRAALHVALRAKTSDRVGWELACVQDVWGVLTAMEQFVGAKAYPQ